MRFLPLTLAAALSVCGAHSPARASAHEAWAGRVVHGVLDGEPVYEPGVGDAAQSRHCRFVPAWQRAKLGALGNCRPRGRGGGW